jgi:hypothetical protein
LLCDKDSASADKFRAFLAELGRCQCRQKAACQRDYGQDMKVSDSEFDHGFGQNRTVGGEIREKMFPGG